MKQISYSWKSVKQDETDQKIWNMLVTKQSETEWNNETYFLFFFKNPFLFCNKWNDSDL